MLSVEHYELILMGKFRINVCAKAKYIVQKYNIIIPRACARGEVIGLHMHVCRRPHKNRQISRSASLYVESLRSAHERVEIVLLIGHAYSINST